MGRYIERRQKVEAVQWDGSSDGAQIISFWAYANVSNRSNLLQDLYLIRSPGTPQEESLHLPPRGWLIRHWNGSLTTMTNAEFQAAYEEELDAVDSEAAAAPAEEPRATVAASTEIDREPLLS
jgi:hypothetical protein